MTREAKQQLSGCVVAAGVEAAMYPPRGRERGSVCRPGQAGHTLGSRLGTRLRSRARSGRPALDGRRRSIRHLASRTGLARGNSPREG